MLNIFGEKSVTFDPATIGSHATVESADIDMIDLESPSPQEFGVEHEHFRKGQYQTIEFVRDNDVETTVVEQPTGSGKSAVARALSSQVLWDTDEQVRAVVLTHTKALQEQYGGLYDAHLMKGKSNYPCAHDNALPGQMADECLYADRGMYKCPFSSDCPYLIAKRLSLTEPFVSTNYAYWLTSRQLKGDVLGGDGIRVLICDEGHLLSNTVLEWSGTTINEHDRRRFELQPFPVIASSSSSTSALDQILGGPAQRTETSLDKALAWLKDSERNVKITLRNLLKMAPFRDDDLRKQARQVELFLNKLSNAIEAIMYNQDDWFVRSGPGVVYNRGEKIPGIVIKPLTARYQYNRLFTGATRTLVMSATIGDEQTFVEELGIKNHAFRVVKNLFPASARPVHDLKAPKMGRSSKPADYEKQADVIATAINGVPSDWSGIIHTKSKSQAFDLARRLNARGLSNRIYVPQQKKGDRYLSTTDQLIEWELRKKRVPNSIMIAWQFWEGFDGRDEKICIVAKVPYPFLGDEYESARQRYSGSFYLQRTAWDLVQALGRTRRGRLCDYDLNGQVNGLVAIADGNWINVRKYMPAEIKESII